MSGYEPDWPLIVGVLAAIASAAAVLYSRRSAHASERALENSVRALEIQEIHHKATVLADELTDDQLLVLRHAARGWRTEAVIVHDTEDKMSLMGTRILAGNLWPDPSKEENAWFFDSLRPMENEELIDGKGITASGRNLLRANRDRTPAERQIKAMPPQKR